jgi:competence protein ComEA
LLARLGTSPRRAGPVPGVEGGWVPQRPSALAGPLGVRWAPARRAVIGLAVVLLVAVLVAVLLVWRAQPSAEAAPVVRRSGAVGTTATTPVATPVAASENTAPGAPAPAEVVVHVVGAVHRPGLVHLPVGSRVADAVAAAGGTTAGARAASVNLARLLVDGEQLVVQRRGRAPLVPAPGAAAPAVSSGAGAGAGAGSAPSGPVDLNSATQEALDALPGIGPVLAQRILEWRTAHGRFSSVDELGEVSGIGEATLADLRPVVTV